MKSPATVSDANASHKEAGRTNSIDNTASQVLSDTAISEDIINKSKSHSDGHRSESTSTNTTVSSPESSTSESSDDSSINSDSESNTESVSDSDTDTETGNGTESVSDTDTETETGNGTESVSDSDTDTETGNGTESEDDSETSDTNTIVEAETTNGRAKSNIRLEDHEVINPHVASKPESSVSCNNTEYEDASDNSATNTNIETGTINGKALNSNISMEVEAHKEIRLQLKSKDDTVESLVKLTAVVEVNAAPGEKTSMESSATQSGDKAISVDNVNKSISHLDGHRSGSASTSTTSSTSTVDSTTPTESGTSDSSDDSSSDDSSSDDSSSDNDSDSETVGDSETDRETGKDTEYEDDSENTKSVIVAGTASDKDPKTNMPLEDCEESKPHVASKPESGYEVVITDASSSKIGSSHLQQESNKTPEVVSKQNQSHTNMDHGISQGETNGRDLTSPMLDNNILVTPNRASATNASTVESLFTVTADIEASTTPTDASTAPVEKSNMESSTTQSGVKTISENNVNKSNTHTDGHRSESASTNTTSSTSTVDTAKSTESDTSDSSDDSSSDDSSSVSDSDSDTETVGDSEADRETGKSTVSVDSSENLETDSIPSKSDSINDVDITEDSSIQIGSTQLQQESTSPTEVRQSIIVQVIRLSEAINAPTLASGKIVKKNVSIQQKEISDKYKSTNKMSTQTQKDTHASARNRKPEKLSKRIPTKTSKCLMPRSRKPYSKPKEAWVGHAPMKCESNAYIDLERKKIHIDIKGGTLPPLILTKHTATSKRTFHQSLTIDMHISFMEDKKKKSVPIWKAPNTLPPLKRSHPLLDPKPSWNMTDPDLLNQRAQPPPFKFGLNKLDL